MSSKPPDLLQSGIEPVDKLLGGLMRGALYLAHGDIAAQSILGIKFLIEGLKRGDNVALVTHHSPQDAMRQFARLGYDCLEDVQKGKLVILEYSEQIIGQVARLTKLTPILRELAWWLKESSPKRFVFDSVAELVQGKVEGRKDRIREFAEWAQSLDATVLLIADEAHQQVVQELSPYVKESFHIQSNSLGNRRTGSLAFEKSTTLKPQAIEIDAFKGLFLLNGANQFNPSATVEPITETSKPVEPAKTEEIFEAFSAVEFPVETIAQHDTHSETQVHSEDFPHQVEPVVESTFVQAEVDATSTPQTTLESVSVVNPARLDTSELVEQEATEAGAVIEVRDYDFSDFVEELDVEIDEFDLNKVETHAQIADPRRRVVELKDASAKIERLLNDDLVELKQNLLASAREQASLRRSTDFTSESGTEPVLEQEKPAVARLTIEEKSADSHSPKPQMESAESTKRQTLQTGTKKFTVAVIDYDRASCERIARALQDFHVEIYNDSVNGIASILASPPDLVLLDVDAPIVDGFKVLAHIRASLSVPIIVLSKFHIRASDRILSTELGADYFLTKPFSTKELKQKARQLIARYRGINSWIATPVALSEAIAHHTDKIAQKVFEEDLSATPGADFRDNLPRAKKDKLEPYSHFIVHVEEQIKMVMEKGNAFSIVGYRLEPQAQSIRVKVAEFFDLVSSSVRNDDLISTNPHNDLVILLSDTDIKGAKGFVNRLRKQITGELHQALTVWIRSFPNFEESSEILSADKSTPPNQQNNASNSARA
ncbi:MAG: ATPase domain-containing protein [Acidobacteriota bacterium]